MKTLNHKERKAHKEGNRVFHHEEHEGHEEEKEKNASRNYGVAFAHLPRGCKAASRYLNFAPLRLCVPTYWEDRMPRVIRRATGTF